MATTDSPTPIPAVNEDFTLGVVPLGDIVDEKSTEEDVSRVVAAITRTVEPTSWVVGGGRGTIVVVKSAFDNIWRLTIFNSKKNIRTIACLTVAWRLKAKTVEDSDHASVDMKYSVLVDESGITKGFPSA